MKVKVKSRSSVRFFAMPWTAAYQAPPSMGFPRQEYWSEIPLYPQYNAYNFMYNTNWILVNKKFKYLKKNLKCYNSTKS